MGMFVGPILSGYGTEQIGYYGMNCLLGSYNPPVKISSCLNANVDQRGCADFVL